MQLVQYHNLGRISYQNAWDYQTIVHQKLLHNKLKINNKRSTPSLHHLIICEHNHVYTLGKTGSTDNLLLNETELSQNQIEFYKINRGGDITYHGIGQLTVYPIFDLEYFYRDVHRYVRNLEEVVIQLLEKYGINSNRNKDYTGVWIEQGIEKRKICAIGVHLSKWLSLHGLALNVNTDLQYFKNIIPCGIDDPNRSVTSIEEELGKAINLEKVKKEIKQSFSNVFDLKFI